MALQGIITVAVTPFDDRGEVDYAAFERLLDFVLEAGVHYVVPCGSTGEYYALSHDERLGVMKFVADYVDGRAGLWAGTNAPTTRETIQLSQRAQEIGYEGVMLAAPYYSLPTTEELAEHYRSVADELDLPVLLYNFPARTGVDMNSSFLQAVAPMTQIVGIKESSGEIARLHELLVDYSDRLEIVCGADDQALEYFVWGAKSWVAGASNFLPKQHVALYESCVENRDFEEGRRIMRRLLPLFMAMEGGGKYIQYAKLGCELAGVPVGPPRPPLQPVTGAERQEFARLFEQAGGSA